jgi:carboxyl-terminal processing protease
MSAFPRRPSIAVLIALLCPVVCLAPIVARADQPKPATVTSSQSATVDLAKLFDAVVETTERHFYDTQRLARLNWLKQAEAVRSSVVKAATRDDGVRQINALLGKLGISHTALFTPDDYEYYILLDIVGPGRDAGNFLSRVFWGSDPYYPGIGVFTKSVDGRHFVDGAMEGSPAASAGIGYGDEIISVDGSPYSPIAAFRDKIGHSVDIALRRKSGAEPLHLRVPVVAITPGKAFSMATAASARVIEANGKRIGYVHVWSTHDSGGLRTALEALPKQPALDSLIVDMRGRVGGTMEIADDYLSILSGGANPYWGRTKILSRFKEEESRPSFRGRAALLIDEHTRSAGEIMAYGFKRSGFGPVIGVRSAGAVSSGQTCIMPGDFLLYLAGSRIEFDGKSLEGVGVVPDRIVERPLPYANGADPVLGVATSLLSGGAG